MLKLSKTVLLSFGNDDGMVQDAVNVWSFGRVFLQEQVHHCLDLFRVDGSVYRLVAIKLDIFEGQELSSTLVGQFEVAHVIEDAPDLPYVHRASPPYVVQLLWRVHLGVVRVMHYVFLCRAERPRILAVAYLHSPILRKDDLLRDQTAMD